MTNMSFTSDLCDLRSKMSQFAHQFTKNLDDAEDLVQDALIKAIRYSYLYKEGTNLQAWVFTIMKNTFINNYRKLQRVSKVVTVSEDFNSFELAKSATQNAGEGKFMQNDIYKAINGLPKENMVPFTMYFEGFKYCEIAEELHMPIGTVKTRIHVARKLLKANLKMYSEQFPRAIHN